MYKTIIIIEKTYVYSQRRQVLGDENWQDISKLALSGRQLSAQ